VHEIHIESSAEKQFLALPLQERKRIILRINALALNPKPAGCKKIMGSKNTWRIRVGDYRIVYDLDEKEQAVHIWRVKHRREAYR
jgi:mRNA interferase RelE/StbE